MESALELGDDRALNDIAIVAVEEFGGDPLLPNEVERNTNVFDQIISERSFVIDVGFKTLAAIYGPAIQCRASFESLLVVRGLRDEELSTPVGFVRNL